MSGSLHRIIWIGLGGLLALAGACAPTVIEMEPMVFQLDGADQTIRMNTLEPEALFAEGRVAFRQERYKDSAVAFELFVKEFPADKRYRNALYNAGLSRERLEQWRQALDHYNAYLMAASSEQEKADGRFRRVMCYLGLEDGPGVLSAVETLKELKLSPLDGAEASALEGRGYELSGDLAKAERAYLRALQVEDSQTVQGPFQRNAHLAMAQYRIGEIYRFLFDAVLFRLPVERMKRDLHDKSTLFLKAQAAYLRAIRRDNKDWALAAGFRTGEIYEAFYRDFMKAEVPPELSEEEVAIYYNELREQVQPLLKRAIRVYEKNIKMGARSRQSQSPWVNKTEKHLKQLRELVREEEERRRREADQGVEEKDPSS